MSPRARTGAADPNLKNGLTKISKLEKEIKWRTAREQKGPGG